MTVTERRNKAASSGASGLLDYDSTPEGTAVVAASASEAASPARTAQMLLRLVRAAQPISRVELARRLDVNRSTVTELVKPLIAAGVVREEPLAQPSGTSRASGRPPVGLFFNSDNDYFIGVNIGVRR